MLMTLVLFVIGINLSVLAFLIWSLIEDKIKEQSRSLKKNGNEKSNS